jgi:hypothetical protein
MNFSLKSLIYNFIFSLFIFILVYNYHCSKIFMIPWHHSVILWHWVYEGNCGKPLWILADVDRSVVICLKHCPIELGKVEGGIEIII